MFSTKVSLPYLLYSKASAGGFKKLLAWNFSHSSWTLQYVFEGALFSKLLEGFIGVPYIYLRMLGKGLQLKTTTLLVFFLWLVNKVFEKLVNNRIVDYLEKRGLFSDFQNGFKSSWSTADLLTVLSDRTAGAFNRSGATWAVVLEISKAVDRVWHTGLLRKLKSYGISGQIF